MFDPYREWLDIPREARPPTYYQLLGIGAEEATAATIREAALRRTVQVRIYQVGPHAELCTRVLNEIAQARAILLNPNTRQEYDARLAKPAPALDADLPEGAAALLVPPTDAPDSGERDSPASAGRRSPAPLFLHLLGALAYLLVLLLGGAASFWVTYAGLPNAAPVPAKAKDASRPTAAPGDRAP